MTGQELAEKLFKAIETGTAADDPTLVDEIVKDFVQLTPDEAWWFVIKATAADRERRDRTAFAAFNVAVNKRPEFLTALKAMQDAPRPDRKPTP